MTKVTLWLDGGPAKPGRAGLTLLSSTTRPDRCIGLPHAKWVPFPLGEACVELENSSCMRDKTKAPKRRKAAAEELLSQLRSSCEVATSLRLEATPSVSKWSDDENPASR